MPALLMAISPGPEECLSHGRRLGSTGLMKKGIDVIHCNYTGAVMGGEGLWFTWKLGPLETQDWMEDQLGCGLPRLHWHWVVSLSGWRLGPVSMGGGSLSMPSEGWVHFQLLFHFSFHSQVVLKPLNLPPFSQSVHLPVPFSLPGVPGWPESLPVINLWPFIIYLFI